jgi:hypothetical protein
VHEVKIPVVKEGNYCQFFDKKKYVISVWNIKAIEKCRNESNKNLYSNTVYSDLMVSYIKFNMEQSKVNVKTSVCK